ncbi:MAG: hypothetical protein ACR2GL_04965, partial [Thermoleophilaceae bacterium]
MSVSGPEAIDRNARILEQAGILAQAGEIAVGLETGLCSSLDADEREQLIELLLRLQVGRVDLPGVHPGLGSAQAKEPPTG